MISEIKNKKVTTILESESFYVTSGKPSGVIPANEDFTSVEIEYVNDTLDRISIRQASDVSLYYRNSPQSLSKLASLREAINKVYDMIVKREYEGKF